ncbi:MAG: glycoside hydrolase family 16 protein [Rectinema subterraneum]|uniref:glycoside hydrolase family 16 protein n=1 Tax=Rectinema subterraneum TaxID=2653714 RepID=UPI003C7B9351
MRMFLFLRLSQEKKSKIVPILKKSKLAQSYVVYCKQDMMKFNSNMQKAFVLLISFLFSLISVLPAIAEPRDIFFGGMIWGVRQTAGPVDPGPNIFSNLQDQVWVDEQGAVHLTVQKRGTLWTASEIMAKKDTGYGTYRFTVSSSLADLDPSIVFGFFTWDKAPESFNREIDIEISRWGTPDGLDGWFTVQPYDKAGNQHSFYLPNAQSYTFELRWALGEVQFELVTEKKNEEWTYREPGVPAPGRARLRINLWLFRGKAPAQDWKHYKVVIRDFSFLPLL